MGVKQGVNIDILNKFQKVVRGKTTILVKDKYKDPILVEKMFPERKLRKGNLWPGVSLLRGRNAIPSIPIEGSQERMMVKHYQHGGFFRKITGDILLGNTRPFRELVILEAAFQKGIPVPEALAARVVRIFGPFFRGDIVYKEIPYSDNLLEYLKRLNERPMKERVSRKREIIERLAEAIKKMHTSGIYHADLNVRNVLIQDSGAGIQVYLVDFDCSRIKENLRLRERIKNLARFNRSCEKWKAPISATDKLRFFFSYFRGNRLVEMNQRKYIRKCSRFHWGHRIYWRLFG